MAEILKQMVVTSELEKSLIFQSLMRVKQPVNVLINNIEYVGLIEHYDTAKLLVSLKTPYIGDLSAEIRTNFVFNHNYHYFLTSARQMGERKLLLRIPDTIFKNMARKYERLQVQGKVFMNFTIIIKPRHRDLQDFSLLTERIILQEVKKAKPAVDKIISGIKSLVSEYSQKFQLKIFKPGDRLTTEEQILKETKKIFLIYDSYEDSIEEKRFLDEDIQTVGSIYQHWLARGEPQNTAESRLIDLLQQKRNARIFSECCVPILIEGEVAGYVRLTNDVDYHRSLKPAFAQKAAEYAAMLVEALAKYDYFRLKSGADFKIPVINISAGGLLFRLDDAELKKFITRSTVLQISLLFPERQMQVRGLVYRIDESASEYGVNFQEIGEGEMRYIDELVKKKPPSRK